MTRPALNCLLVCDTQQDANRVVDFLNQRLALHAGIIVLEPPTAILYHDGRYRVNCSVYFSTELAADSVYADVEGGWTTGPQSGRIKLGSLIRRLNNFDDEGQGQSDYQLYSRTK